MTEVREVEAVAKAWLIYADNGMLIKAVTSEQERDSLLFTNGGKFPTWTAEPLYTSPTPANASDEAVRAVVTKLGALVADWEASAARGDGTAWDPTDRYNEAKKDCAEEIADILTEVAKMLGDGR